MATSNKRDQMRDSRILVVDDDQAALNNFKEWLSDEGYWAEGVPGGREVLPKIKARHYHIVLMALVLKEMTGIQMMKQIKKISPETEVIVVTAYPTVEAVIRSFRAGVFDFLVKPVKKKDLLNVIRRSEEKKREGYQMNTLRRIKEISEKANAEKNMFLVRISGDIRDVMRDIVRASDELLKSTVDRRQAENASFIKTGSLQLLSAADDISDVLKIEAGQLDLQEADFKLEDVFQDVGKTIYAEVKDRPIQLIYEIEPDVPSYVNGDAKRLKQILMNLLTNAVAVTTAGEIRIKARLMTILGKGCHIFFVVKDSGPGIPKSKQMDIFKPFPDRGILSKSPYPGHGLGLWMCKVLTEKMGGLISLHSEKGKGSEFRFSLRFNAAEKAHP